MVASYYGGTGRGFRVLSDEILKLPAEALLFMVVALAVVAVASATASRWFPRVVNASATKAVMKNGGGVLPESVERVVAPSAGVWLAPLVFLLVFPLWGLFTPAGGGWWVFLLAGWGGAACVWYYMVKVRHISVAVMKCGGRYFISNRWGLCGWRPLESLCNAGVREESVYGTRAYRITCRNRDNRTVGYGWIALSEYCRDDLPWLLDFVKKLDDTPSNV